VCIHECATVQLNSRANGQRAARHQEMAQRAAAAGRTKLLLCCCRTQETPGADLLYPTSVLRPVYCYTVLSSARCGQVVRGTQRPATIACCTAPCYKRLYIVMAPPPMSTQLTVNLPTCIDVRAPMRVWSLTFPAPVLLPIYLPVLNTNA
jgi:hypothetical protein